MSGTCALSGLRVFTTTTVATATHSHRVCESVLPRQGPFIHTFWKLRTLPNSIFLWWIFNMAFLLPVISWLPLLGSMFDLPSYKFVDELPPLYENGTISLFKQVTRINELDGEYVFIDSKFEFSKYVGLGVATNLKTFVDVYDYRFGDRLKFDFEPAEKRVYLLLKLTLKTVNESIRFEAPVSNACQLLTLHQKKTHYVKSLVRGYSAYQLLYMYPVYYQNLTGIRESLLRSLSKRGPLDEEFWGKFNSALKEGEIASYAVKRPFGVLPPNVRKEHPAVADVDGFRNQFLRIMETDEEGDVLYYEMEPLSSILPGLHLIDINWEIYKQLYDVERKIEDVDTSILLLQKWRNDIQRNHELSAEEEGEINSYLEALYRIYNDLHDAVREVDISTLGSVRQFSKALRSYGKKTTTNKYRKKVERYRLRFEREHNIVKTG